VCSIFCATANPVEVVVARSEQGQGVLGGGSLWTERFTSRRDVRYFLVAIGPA
jgi:adenosine/AMP kinase